MTGAEKKVLNTFFTRVRDCLEGGKAGDCANQEFYDDSSQELDSAMGSVFLDARSSADISDKESFLSRLRGEVLSCARCRLCSYRKNAVPGCGVIDPLVMVIGEGPGADEDEQGLPFVGRAGRLLDKMLASIGLSRDTNCYIANIVKCRPPQNRTPAPDEIEFCRGFIERQIDVLRPKFILAMGRTAVQALLQTDTGIGKLHGQFRSYGAIPLMATYHPSALLRDESLKRPAWEDLKRLREKLIPFLSSYPRGDAD